MLSPLQGCRGGITDSRAGDEPLKRTMVRKRSINELEHLDVQLEKSALRDGTRFQHSHTTISLILHQNHAVLAYIV
jgi:hypothetical protein